MIAARWIVASLAALLLAACSSDGPAGPKGGAGGAGGEGGEGGWGDGGSGGSGGFDGEGGRGGDEEGPSWEEVELRQGWRYQGFGEVFSLTTGAFLGDGGSQIAIGGRRPVLLSADGSELLWYVDWPEVESLLYGGDNDWVEDLAPIRNERGADDLLITRSMGGAALLDGRDGSEIWSLDSLDVRFNFPKFTLFGDPDAPLFFPAYGYSAYDPATGAVAWELPRGRYYPMVLEARRGPDAPTGLFLVSEGERMVGHGGHQSWIALPGFTAVSSSGEILASIDFRDGEEGIEPVVAGVADLDGDGVDSLLVAFFDRPFRALNPDGSLRWEKAVERYGSEPTRNRITHILNHDLDGDGREEILLIVVDAWEWGLADGAATLLVLDQEGEELYHADFDRQVVEAFVIEVDDGAPILLLGIGTGQLLHGGEVLALRLDPLLEDMVEFRYELPSRARRLALLGEGAETRVVVGTDDGLLRTIDLEGSERWDHHLACFLSKIAAIPQADGPDRIAFGDISGTLSLLDGSGTPQWHRRLSVGATGSLDGLTTATFEAGGEVHIVAAATAAKECCKGTLEVFSVEGEQIMERPLPGAPLGLAARDLDGDGSDELLVLEGMQDNSDRCRLRSYLRDGRLDWELPIAICEYGELAIWEGPEGEIEAIGVRTHPGIRPYPATLSVVEPDGTLRWHLEEEAEGSLWLRATPLGLLSGGLDANPSVTDGFVSLRDLESGARIWRTGLPGREHPDIPGSWIEGTSEYGISFAHGSRRFAAATTVPNDLFLLDLATGEVVWSVFTEREENWETQRHVGGPLIFVEPTEATPAYLLTAQQDSSRKRSEVMAISLDGEIERRLPIYSNASEVILAWKEGVPWVVVRALLGIYAVELAPLEP